MRVYEEKASGGRRDRPELHRLLAELDKDDVVVWKLDRLSRSLKDMLLILDKIEGADVRPEHRLPMAGDPERPAAALDLV